MSINLLLSVFMFFFSEQICKCIPGELKDFVAWRKSVYLARLSGSQAKTAVFFSHTALCFGQFDLFFSQADIIYLVFFCFFFR